MERVSTLSVASPEYLNLIGRFPLKPLRSEAEVAQARAILKELSVSQPGTVGEEDYSEVLAQLVDGYEQAQQSPASPSDDALLVQHLLDSRGLTLPQLAETVGMTEVALAAICAGHARLTRDQLVQISRYFQIGPEMSVSGK